ncbi:hypothetical protein E2562_006232 [Oryza meyeriana var. granulata]|uniref:Uncharacterized protein n=1 Tax=Oryza meyeriana var. granulata TaxID=110450 RepID=A0A6G1CNW6_9ORYZ|nr:hypothetical protein E2562_006232 [Oryza meyeriana var. granulata]
MATGENKARLTTGLALTLLMLTLPSPLFFLIHHRLLLIKKALLCDGLRPNDGDEEVIPSTFALPTAGR